MMRPLFRRLLIALLLVLTLLVVVSIGIPKYFRYRTVRREVAAVKSLQSLHQAQQEHRARHGRFAASLDELGQPAEKNGYRFRLRLRPEGYLLEAVPTRFPEMGFRSFYSDETGTIRETWGPEPDPPPPLIGSTLPAPRPS